MKTSICGFLIVAHLLLVGTSVTATAGDFNASAGASNSVGVQASTTNSGIANEVQNAIAGDPSLVGDDVSVAVKGGELELNGTVCSYWDEVDARKFASRYAAGHNLKVADHIEEGPTFSCPW